ncbi:MAG: hypothetical protein KDD05_09035 [Psychroserpens sp.]|jgi:hypothetical protein|nr:hypothetical protein [Psychroserpens sp.]
MMKVNLLKLVAALFIVASIIALYLNDFIFNTYALVLNIIGVIIFLFGILRNSKQ